MPLLFLFYFFIFSCYNKCDWWWSMEKRAVVLSGGGAKGAYQVGVWKALRKLHYSYQIVTGTSVGALNGMLMVQHDYHKCIKLC